ncbi:MAG: hypothetical protein EXR02_07370 [Rhodospirillales bacterium]|nr:hypothetical protein [Rhodospirillales bacterium]
MTVVLASYDIQDPKDMSALKAALDRHDAPSIRRVAIFSKLNGEYDDGARENAKAAVDKVIAAKGVADRTEMITIIGCEGASTPFGYAFIDVDDKSVAVGDDKRLAIGLGHADPGAEAELDGPAFGGRVKACVLGAMRDAGLGPDGVATVIVNGPPATSGDAVLRSRRMRAVAALGAGAAIGEIDDRSIVDAAIVSDTSLYTRRVQTFVGPQIKRIEIIVLGNRAGGGGDLVAYSAVTTDLFDVRAVKVMLREAGLQFDHDGEFTDGDRVVAAILKAGVGPGGTVNGAPTAIFNSRTPPEKHVRAAASGVYGALLKNTRIFSTMDPVQQAPWGGSQLCCVIKAK